jgi:hypothetical protein
MPRSGEGKFSDGKVANLLRIWRILQQEERNFIEIGYSLHKIGAEKSKVGAG